VIPVVNYDAYLAIAEDYNTNGKFIKISKNRNSYKSQKLCKNPGKGVDLNRNFDFAFAQDEIGSIGEN
jgi:hypothetical protein